MSMTREGFEAYDGGQHEGQEACHQGFPCQPCQGCERNGQQRSLHHERSHQELAHTLFATLTAAASTTTNTTTTAATCG
jgi:hypothetical protein